MQLETVSVKRLYLQIAEQISDMIRSGQLKAGSRLPSERDLAARFQVSRPTIREAMIALEVSELVEVRSGSGVYVLEQQNLPGRPSDIDEPGPYEILEARMAVEGETAALAAMRISPQEIQALNGLVKRMDDLSQSDAEAEELADQEFHLGIAQAARNSALYATVQWLWAMRRSAETSVAFHNWLREQGSHPTVADHQRILAAIQTRDPAAARDAMHAHLQHVQQELSEYAFN